MDAKLFFFFALVALVFAGDVKKDESKKSADTAKPKRGLAGLGYGFNDFGYSFPGFSSYNAYEPLAHTVITKQLAYPVPHPVPVPVERHVPYPVKVPYAVPVDRPYPVHVAKPYPVEVTRHVPVAVDRPVPYAVKVPVKVPVPAPYAVKVPEPFPIPIVKHVGIPYAQHQPWVFEKYANGW